MYLLQNTEEILMTISVPISAINHMVVAGICNYISLVPILYYLDLEQEPQLITVFLPAERPVPSILKGLDDYSYFFNKKFYKVNKAHRKAETYLHPIHI